LTSRPSKPTKATTPGLGIVATSSVSNKTTNDLGAATNSHTMPPRDQEAMTKVTERPCRTGRLANHHHAHSAATTGTVAPRHTMVRRGHKTMTTTTPEHMLHQDKMAFLVS
jgi:hypothetical protein